MLSISCPLDGKFCESINQYVGPNPKDNQAFLDYPTGQILGNPVLYSNYAELVTQSKSSSSTAMKQAHKVASNDVNPDP
jgi:hypothetical protein